MFASTMAAILIIATGNPPDPVFGDVNRRQISAVLSQLDALEQLPPDVFAPLGMSVLSLVDNAKSQAIRIRSLQVVLARGNSSLAQAMADMLNGTLDGMGNPGRDLVSKSSLLQAACTWRVTHWSDAMRTAPQMRALLLRLATWSISQQGRGDEPASLAAVYRLIELAPDDDTKRQVLLQIVSASGIGAWPASWKLVPLANEPIKASLRALVSGSAVNPNASQILGEIGDMPSLQIAAQQLGRGITAAEGRSSIEEMQWKIEAQNPPANLLNVIAHPRPLTDDREWAIRRAVQLGVSRDSLRDAVLAWASTTDPIGVSYTKKVATDLDVLHEGDLPAVPPFRPVHGCPIYDPDAPEVPIVATNRVGSIQPWRPKEQNFDVLVMWFHQKNWAGINATEKLQQINAKLCELGLFPPDVCDRIAASQPGG